MKSSALLVVCVGVAAILLAQPGCKTKANERYCDAVTPCAGPRMRCDLERSECVPDGTIDGDMAVGPNDDQSVVGDGGGGEPDAGIDLRLVCVDVSECP